MIIELAVIGIFVGFLSGFFGVGGGMILVPVLIYLGFDIKDAIGISVVQMLFSSIYGSYLNHKRGSLQVYTAIFFGAGGFIGGFGGGFLVDLLSSFTLTIILLFVVLFAIYRFFSAPVSTVKKDVDNKIVFFLVGLIVGILAVSVGVGGSIILIPIMVSFFYFDLKKAIGASLFFVAFSSLAGFISLSYYGYVDYYHGVIIGISSLLGVFFGINASHKTDPKRHKNLILLLDIIILGLIVNKLI